MNAQIETSISLLSDIQNHIQAIKDSNTISRIQKELILSKIAQCYDLIFQIQTETSIGKSTAPVSDIKPIEIHEEPGIISEIIEEEQAVALEHEIIESFSEKKEAIEAPSEIEITEPPIVDQETIEVSAKIESKEITEHKEPVFVKPITEQDLSQKLGKKPITNISSAIGINERFQFIKELFSNNVEVYTEVIQILNELSSFDQALEYLEKNHSLDYDTEITQRFLSIVERRYL